nr:site-specific integrase [Rhizobium leguminosarum]
MVIPLANGTVDFKVTSSTQSIRFSLRTANPAEVKVRQAEALAYVEQYLEALRNGRPIQLTPRQITALAGEFYKSWSSGPDTTGSLTLTPSTGEFFTREDDEFDEAEMLSAAMERVRERAAGQDDEYFLKVHGPDIDRMLTAFGVPEVTPGSRAKLAVAFGKMLLEGLETNARIAGGDYSPDPNLAKFPQWEAPNETPRPNHKPGSPVSLTGLEEGWWAEAKAAGKSESTHESYGNTFRLFSTFLGHDDARRVTAEDVIRYKDHRLSAINPKTKKPVSAKTVKASDLTAVKSVFDWAVSNKKFPSNPAADARLKLGKKVKLREREFTAQEAASILTAANSIRLKQSSNQTEAAKRWVPWLSPDRPVEGGLVDGRSIGSLGLALVLLLLPLEILIHAHASPLCLLLVLRGGLGGCRSRALPTECALPHVRIVTEARLSCLLLDNPALFRCDVLGALPLPYLGVR